jgi:hypothetical protein
LSSIYLYDPDTDAFVISEVLDPGQISVSAYRRGRVRG